MRRILKDLLAVSLGTALLAGAASLCGTAGAAIHTPADGPALATVLASGSLAPGDTIILNAASTYTAPAGGFVLREVGTQSDTSYITIQSSALASLPLAGQRVFPTNAANMPNVRSFSGTNERVFKTAAAPARAHHYKLIGLEIIGPANNAAVINPLIQIGYNNSTQNALNLVPHHFIIDRCYIHDNSSTQTIHRGIELHGAHVDVINSHISGIKNGNAEAHVIWGVNGDGPFNIINNYLDGGAINVFFGGASNNISGMTPSNILVQRNHFTKPLGWKTDPGNWWVKNHFELKCGINVTVDSNLFENCWEDAGQQHGASLVFKCVQGASPNGSSWYLTENITVTNNIVRNVGTGMVISGSKNATGGALLGLPRDMMIRNNLFYDVAQDVSGDTGRTFQMGSGTPDVTMDHNTAFQTAAVMYAGDSSIDNPTFTYTNNMTMKSQWGFIGGGTGDGGSTFTGYFPGLIYQKNVIFGSSTGNYLPNFAGGWSPNTLGLPTNWANVLVNQASPGTDFSGWKVVGWNQPTNFTLYPYNNAGTDGKDIGCDIDELNTATAGCISGVWGGSPPGGGTLIEDFANSIDHWGGAYTGLTADDLITGGKLIFLSNGSGGSLIVSSQHKHNGENVSSAGVWTTGTFSGQGFTKLTFSLKNNGTNTLTASNFTSGTDYFAISCKRNSTSGNLASNRAAWNLSNIFFAGQSSIGPGQTITVSVPFASPNTWLTSGISNQYGMDPANDRYIFAGFRFSVASGGGVKNFEIDDFRIEP